MAAKALGQQWLLARFGVGVAPSDLVIIKDAHGSPSLRLRGEIAERLGADVLPALSLAHSDGVAIAALSLTADTRIGIDIERIAPRPDGFADTWLAPQEQRLVISTLDGAATDEQTRITALWCIKEATTKALGLGFKLALTEVAIAAVAPDGTATLALRGAALTRLVALGGGEIEARVRVDARFAVCESLVHVTHSPAEDDPARLAALAALLDAQGYLAPKEAGAAGPEGGVLGHPFGVA